MKRELLKKMASVANDLDANGLEVEANAITNIMVKIAAGDTPLIKDPPSMLKLLEEKPKTETFPWTVQPNLDKPKTKIDPRTDTRLQDVKTFKSPKERPGYDKNNETDFQRILNNYESMPKMNKMYYFLKGLASEYYKKQDPATFANFFIFLPFLYLKQKLNQLNLLKN